MCSTCARDRDDARAPRGANAAPPQHLQRLREAAAKLERWWPPATMRSCRSPTVNSTRTINDAAGNPGALPIVDSHWLLLAALLKRYGYGDERFARVIEEHQHLIQAIERGDGIQRRC